MTSAVLIPGAGGVGWYWHLVERDLRHRGYDAIAVDLSAGGRTGLPAYADAVVHAIDGRTDVALVAQSMGASTAPLVWQRVPTSRVVFVNAMIPRPGETPGDWWANVGSEQARTAAAAREGYSREFDLRTYFLHDVPEALVAEMQERAASQFELHGRIRLRWASAQRSLLRGPVASSAWPPPASGSCPALARRVSATAARAGALASQ